MSSPALDDRKRNLVDHDVVLPRERVIDGLIENCEESAPLVVVSRQRDGSVYVAATIGGPVADQMLDEAKVAIRVS